jgi:hypothetical protein
MKFVFIDEYHSPPPQNPYTAAVASVWDDSALAPFRSKFIEIIGKAINKEPHQVNAFPTIHGSDMAREYDDDIKFLCFETIAKLSTNFNVKFYHLGYYHHIPLIEKFDVLMLSINQLCDIITSSASDELVFIYELNIAKHKAISGGYNDWQTHYYRQVVGEKNLSIRNSENIIGRYYCDKKNYHMAATDTAWLRAKSESTRADTS